MRKIVILLCIYVLYVVAHNDGIKEAELFEFDCEDEPLDQELEGPSVLTRYKKVILQGCAAPPNRTYVQILRKHNIIIVKELQLLSLAADWPFGPEAISDLPETLKALELSNEEELTHLEPGTLASLPNITDLVLQRVLADKIPDNLELLELAYLGQCNIPKEALNVEILTVASNEPTNIEGFMPRLTDLTVDAPVPNFLRSDMKQMSLIAPDLDVIELGQSFPEPRPSSLSIPEAYTTVTQIILGAVRWKGVPKHLLRGGRRIKYFKANYNTFATLPETLFADTPNMESLNLHNNKLQLLPRKIFAGLNKLKSLYLEVNKLKDVDAIADLTTLNELYLKQNLLRNLCCFGHRPCTGKSALSKLQKLEVLDLSINMISHICDDWLSMPKLKELYLSHNNILTMPCSVLAVRRPPTEVVPSIDLKHNFVHEVSCSKEDYQRSVYNIEKQKVQIFLDGRPLSCSCDVYWLLRMIEERKITAFNYKPSFRGECTVSVLKKKCPKLLE